MKSMKEIFMYCLGVASYVAGVLISSLFYFSFKEIACMCIMYQLVGSAVDIFNGELMSIILEGLLIMFGEKNKVKHIWLYRISIVLSLSMLFLVGMHTGENVQTKTWASKIVEGEVCEAQDMPYWNLNIIYLDKDGSDLSISNIHGKIKITDIRYETSVSYKIWNLPSYYIMKWRKGEAFESLYLTIRPEEETDGGNDSLPETVKAEIVIGAADPLVHISQNTGDIRLYKTDPALMLGKIQYKKVGESEVVELDIKDSNYTIQSEAGEEYWIYYERDGDRAENPRTVEAGETIHCFYYGDGITLNEKELRRLLRLAFPLRQEAKLSNIKICERNPDIQHEETWTDEIYNLEDGDIWLKCGKDVIYSCCLNGEDLHSPCYMVEPLGQKKGEEPKFQWSKADREKAWIEIEVYFE